MKIKFKDLSEFSWGKCLITLACCFCFVLIVNVNTDSIIWKGQAEYVKSAPGVEQKVETFLKSADGKHAFSTTHSEIAVSTINGQRKFNCELYLSGHVKCEVPVPAKK